MAYIQPSEPRIKALPVDEGPLGVHHVELVVESGPGFGDGRGVAQHAAGALNLGQVTSGNSRRRLIIYADLNERAETLQNYRNKKEYQQ